jgi:hypothetical protein
LLGTILGTHNINIADMTVGRSAPCGWQHELTHIGHHAVMVISVDSRVPRSVLQHIANQDRVFFVKQVKL